MKTLKKISAWLVKRYVAGIKDGEYPPMSRQAIREKESLERYVLAFLIMLCLTGALAIFNYTILE